MSRAYYNENDPYCAQWLRNLVEKNLIAPGDVDDRDIRDVVPNDLKPYSQCHFFAGTGGWSVALRLAAVSDHREIWTGSCPCQPFSAAGKAGGFADERHLWPYWHHLIRVCRPSIVFGEQVASPAGLAWLDLVWSDMEDADYAVGAADLCAASVGAPHIRQRAWFVADADGRDASAEGLQRGGEHGQRAQDGGPLRMGNADEPGSQGRISGRNGADQRIAGTAGLARAWSAIDWLFCTDGKARPVKPGIQPLAHGIPGRVGKLRAAGNAIVPQVAAEFIKATLY